MKRAICMILVLLFAVTACAAKNEEPVPSPAWAQAVADMTGARQVVLVAAKEGSEAEFTMHEKDEDGNWHVLVSAPAIIGKNGLGKTKVGDMKTPQGVYTLGFAFGIKEDPGCKLAYHQVTKYDYWSGDQWNRYNEMVDIRDCPSLNVGACEHLIDNNKQIYLVFFFYASIFFLMSQSPRQILFITLVSCYRVSLFERFVVVRKHFNKCGLFFCCTAIIINGFIKQASNFNRWQIIFTHHIFKQTIVFNSFFN